MITVFCAIGLEAVVGVSFFGCAEMFAGVEESDFRYATTAPPATKAKSAITNKQTTGSRLAAQVEQVAEKMAKV
ncbi:MAG: hypothetical protein M3Q33_15095 [Acidobacteriota bacterium]|nr:hypothetical protein [Acidobacteriota bacterium]